MQTISSFFNGERREVAVESHKTYPEDLKDCERVEVKRQISENEGNEHKNERKEVKATRKVMNRIQRRRKANVGWDEKRTQAVTSLVERKNVIVINGVKYAVIKEIGSGGYAKVFSAITEKRQTVAIKITNLEEEDGSINSLLQKEAELMLRIGSDTSKHIIKMLSYELKNSGGINMLYMALELGQGSLQNVLLKEQSSLSMTALR